VNSKLYALPALLLLSLSCGCASTPPLPGPCQNPQPPADLIAPLPPPGYFRQELHRLVCQGPTSDPACSLLPTAPTRSSPSAEEPSLF
jgi:hypothetical protein